MLGKFLNGKGFPDQAQLPRAGAGSHPWGDFKAVTFGDVVGGSRGSAGETLGLVGLQGIF